MRNDKFVGIKNMRILERKPNLRLCGNHFKSGPRIYRVWDPAANGQAVRDGNGWYIRQGKVK